MSKTTKVIFVFGGVYSSLGKGITVSSIGRILVSLNYSVSIMKFDPYLNVDPQNMSPKQHGEVFVTGDGAQTDLDIGNYERFTGKNLNKYSNVTSGKIYIDIISKERHGLYNGQTVQAIPHVTDEIKEKIFNMIKFEKSDFLIVEIGGTIGDSESILFIEAISQFVHEYGKNNSLVCLLSPLVSLSSTSGELKTKPTQHAINQLRSMGIFPDFLILRSACKVNSDVYEKINLNSHISADNIFISPNVNLIYELPCHFYKQNLHLQILKYFGIKYNKNNDHFIKDWSIYIQKIKQIKKTIKIALVGKYTSLHDAYMSIVQSLNLAGYVNGVKINIEWIEAEKLQNKNFKAKFKNCSGIIIPGGFGIRGIEQIISVIKYAREKNIPLFGVCLGMQLMCIEYARNVLKLKNVNSTEFDKKCANPIVDLINGDLILSMVKTNIKKNTIAFKIYKSKLNINERRRHRYGVWSDKYKKLLANGGLTISAEAKIGNKSFIDFIEMKKMKCYIGCQTHPELSSKFNDPNPIFNYFVKCLISK